MNYYQINTMVRLCRHRVVGGSGFSNSQPYAKNALFQSYAI